MCLIVRAGGVRGRGVPAGAGGGRAGAGPRLRRRAPARHRPPRRRRHHQVTDTHHTPPHTDTPTVDPYTQRTHERCYLSG